LHPSCLAIKCSGPLTTLLARGSRWFCQDCRTCSAIPSCSVTEHVSEIQTKIKFFRNNFVLFIDVFVKL